MLNKIISAITGAPLETVAGYFSKKQELKQQLKLAKLEGEIQIEKAKADRISALAKNDHEWELAQIENSGWKDEWVLILLSVPLILVFIPGLSGYVLVGFNVLAQTPQWYQWMIGAIFTAIYGIRLWRRKD